MSESRNWVRNYVTGHVARIVPQGEGAFLLAVTPPAPHVGAIPGGSADSLARAKAKADDLADAAPDDAAWVESN